MKWPASNRRTAIAAAAACLVLILCIAVLTAKTSTDVLARPSTFFTDSTGARAMYLIAQRTLPVVEQWRLPITELKLPASSGATLIAMAPDTFGQDEARALDQWVAAGGQLILASNTDWHVQRSARDRAVQDFLARHDIRPGLPAEGTAPNETVEALAGLFETARAHGLSARAIHRHLNSYLSGLIGYRTDVLSKQSHERLAGPLGIAKKELAAYSSDARAIISGRARTDEELVRFALRAAAIARSFNHDAV